MARQRYSKTFTLGRDTTAKEMLHCFALAYFAVDNNPSIEGLVDALCEDDYSKYENYMEYPLLPGAKEISGSQRKTLLDLYEDKPSVLKSFEDAMDKARKTLEEFEDKQKTRKLTAKQLEAKAKNLKILEEKDKNIKKILNTFKRNVKRFSNISSKIYRDKLYKFTADDPSAQSWIKSAYWTAESIGKKNIIGNYSDYIFAHSTSQTSRYIKEQPLSLVATITSSLLEIEQLKPDMFNPADIYIIKKSALQEIVNDYVNVINDIYIKSEDKLNHTPFHRLITTHIREKKCIPISLKKSLTPNPPAHLTGTLYNVHEHHLPLVDSYTHIIKYLSTGLPGLEEKINELITINKVKYKHSIETFDVNFTFNYSELSQKIPELKRKQIILSNEYYSLTTASMTWNALPTNEQGRTIGAYTGGAGFTQVAAILKKYPATRSVFEQIKEHRKNAYLLAMSEYVENSSNITIPSVLNKSTILNEGTDRKSIYNSIKKTVKSYDVVTKNIYALYLVYLNSFLLYGSVNNKEIQVIKESLSNFAINVSNEKIKGLIPTDTLRKYGWTGASKKQLSPPKKRTPTNNLNQNKVREYSKRVYQEDRCAKLEALYFYTGGKGSMSAGGDYIIDNAVLNEFFKKQITITIYGLITKKGSKVFLTVPELKEEKKQNANLTSVSDALGFRATPYFLIGNGADE